MRELPLLYLLQMGNQLLGFVTVPYLAQALKLETFGKVALAQGLASTLTLLVAYGFDLSATRKASLTASREELRQVFAGVFGARLFLATLALGIALLLGLVPAVRATWPLPLLLLGMAVGVALSPGWIFLALNRPALPYGLELFQRVVTLGGAVLLVRKPEDALLYGAIAGGAGVLSGAVGVFLLPRFLGSPLPRPSLGLAWRELWEGRWAALSQAASLPMSGGNVFLLGLLAPPQAVAQYALAEKIGLATYSLLFFPLFRVFYPRLSAHRENRPRFLREKRRALRVTLVLAWGTSLALALLAPYGLSLLFGSAYEGALAPLRLFALWLGVSAFSFAWGYLTLLPLGHDRTHTLLLLGGAATQAGLVLLFSPWGAAGAACAVLASSVALALAQKLHLERSGIAGVWTKTKGGRI